MFNKRFIYNLLFLYLSSMPYLYSQNGYCTFIEQGKIWNLKGFQSDDFGNIVEYDYRYEIKGDTLINDKIYDKIIMIDSRYKSSNLSALVREQNKRVYQYYPWSEKEVLIYDFSNVVDDTICVNNGNWQLVLKNISLLTTQERQRKCFYYESYAYNHTEREWDRNYAYPIYIIEGVGSTFSPVYFTPEFMMSRYRDKLISCYFNGDCIYSEDDFQSFITPISNVSVKKDAKNDGIMYDLSGRILNNIPEHGIFIKNGRILFK